MLGTAAKAIGIGVLSNTVFKLGVAVALGGAAFRKMVLAGLGLLGLASAGALWVGW
jgi:uncharacterized membrane protein (DUF4010 family)